VAILATGCSGDDGDDSDDRSDPAPTTSTETTVTTTAARAIPDGPAAVLSPIEGGEGPFLGEPPGAVSLDDAGYEQLEVMAAGTATSYTADGEPPADGRIALVGDQEADYATRLLVRRPRDPQEFNGTVVVEWLNVSGGVDAGPEFTYTADEILRGGYAWVGVSAQQIGIEGGVVAVEVPGAVEAGAGRGLKGIDPDRYGELSHPGDAFSYDIFTQAGRAVRSAEAGGPLDGLEVEQVLAVGESQSAFALTTYINGVQSLAGVYDGFQVHSRGGAAAPLQTPGGAIDISGSIGGAPTPIRDDLDVPTIIVQTEGDVLGLLGYLPARQDDSESVRLWEIAGTAHADKDQIGDGEEALGCPTPINRGQQGFVLRAALRHLSTWAAGGEAPPEAERLAVAGEGDAATYELDDLGNVRGGVRTPVVDAPVDVLSGLAPEGASIICLLLGSTLPIDDARLAELYPTVEDYDTAYADATDAAIAAGFVLDDDREALLARAQPDRIPG
jgi:hypothetical protein